MIFVHCVSICCCCLHFFHALFPHVYCFAICFDICFSATYFSAVSFFLFPSIIFSSQSKLEHSLLAHYQHAHMYIQIQRHIGNWKILNILFLQSIVCLFACLLEFVSPHYIHIWLFSCFCIHYTYQFSLPISLKFEYSNLLVFPWFACIAVGWLAFNQA